MELLKSQTPQELFAPAFRLEEDSTLKTVIACQYCEWEGRYIPIICKLDGLSDGGAEYDADELGNMRILDAFEMAAEDHIDHITP